MFGIKNIAKKLGKFGKTVIFGNVCQIWQHLATLRASRMMANCFCPAIYPVWCTVRRLFS